MFFNDKEYLEKEFGLADGKWRYASFEIVDLKTKKLLYTKLGSGLHVTERQEWVEKLLDDVQESCLSSS